MPAPRLFIDTDLGPHARVDLPAEQAHYLLSVMRMASGETVRVFNGRDGEWEALLETSGKKRAQLNLGEMRRAQTPPADLHLLFAPLKKTRTDFVVEKAVELGVSALRPVFTERTSAARVSLARMAAQAREAAEQSERLDVPEARSPERLEALIAAWDAEEAGRRLLFCDEAAGEGSGWAEADAGAPPALSALFAAPEHETGQWAILIGPEGGFTPQERALLRGREFVTAVSLGPRILRADTAAVAALTLWQAVLGDWHATAASVTP